MLAGMGAGIYGDADDAIAHVRLGTPLRAGRRDPSPVRRALRRVARAGRARLPSGGALSHAPAARHQHLLRRQALADAGGLGADRARPARPASWCSTAWTWSISMRRGAPRRAGAASSSDAVAANDLEPALHLHRPGGLLGQLAAGARCGRSRRRPRNGSGRDRASPPDRRRAGDRRSRRVLLGRRLAEPGRRAELWTGLQAIAGRAGGRRPQRRAWSTWSSRTWPLRASRRRWP